MHNCLAILYSVLLVQCHLLKRGLPVMCSICLQLPSAQCLLAHSLQGLHIPQTCKHPHPYLHHNLLCLANTLHVFYKLPLVNV